ncbi:hypothetical protein LINGRAHAP2_LOCUS23094, partial [Linum grandiflorum]
SSSHHDVGRTVETENKHLPHVPWRVTVTLEDVAILTGLPMTGKAAYVEYNKEDIDWAALVGEVRC